VAGQHHRPERGAGKRLELWRELPGATADDGSTVTKPQELEDADTILTLLDRFGGYTYSSLMEEDAELIRLVKIQAMGTKREEVEGG